ncbi:hypothetical protein HK104_007447 [Borealophlyctis nickersoniae]|nr:hypothetical protein HK104_007447 [Borealophlyctis nickersoniae]
MTPRTRWVHDACDPRRQFLKSGVDKPAPPTAEKLEWLSRPRNREEDGKKSREGKVRAVDGAAIERLATPKKRCYWVEAQEVRPKSRRKSVRVKRKDTATGTGTRTGAGTGGRDTEGGGRGGAVGASTNVGADSSGGADSPLSQGPEPSDQPLPPLPPPASAPQPDPNSPETPPTDISDPPAPTDTSITTTETETVVRVQTTVSVSVETDGAGPPPPALVEEIASKVTEAVAKAVAESDVEVVR